MINQMYMTFLQVAQSGSFSKAAQQLFISPVSVMKQINNLEAQLEVPLFKRTTQGVTLTAAGRSLFDSVTKINVTANAAIESARSAGQQEKEIIKVGASIMRPGAPLVEIWRKYSDALQDYKLQVVPISDNDITLKSPSTEIGTQIDCVAGPSDSLQWQENYSVLLLGMDKFRLAIPRTHPLADKERLTFADLDGETIVFPPRDQASIIEKICHDIEINHPKITIINTTRFYNTDVFNEYASSNSLLLTRDIWQNLHPLMKTIPVDWDYESPYGLIYAKEPSDKMKRFVSIISQELN